MMDARLPRRDDLTPEERRGFLIACQCVQLFGARVEQQGVSLGGPQHPVPISKVMAHAGRQIRATGEMLALAVGEGIVTAIDTRPAPDLLT